MKIKKPAGTELSKRLTEVLQLIHAKRPLLEYEANGSNRDGELCAVTVWQDGQRIGSIDSDFRKYSPSKGTNETWFAVSCRNIQKKRGSRETKFNKDAKGAAHAVIELFTKKSMPELGVSLITNVKSGVESLHTKVRHRFEECVNMQRSVLIRYFAGLHGGKNPPPPAVIMSQYDNPEVLRKIDNMDIADNILNHIKNKNGYALQIMRDDTILCCSLTNPEDTVKYASTYNMSTALQEKFTILKVLEANQFASDIGVKYERDDGDKKELFYFVVGGETKVM
jgi:hypothetical protein